MNRISTRYSKFLPFEIFLVGAFLALILFIFFATKPAFALHNTALCTDTSPGACGSQSPGGSGNFCGFPGQPACSGGQSTYYTPSYYTPSYYTPSTSGGSFGGGSGFSTSGSCVGYVQVSASRNPLNPNSAFEAQVSGLQSGCSGRSVSFTLQGGSGGSCTLTSGGSCSAFMRSPATAGTYALTANVSGVGSGQFTLYVQGNADAGGSTVPNGGYNFNNYYNYQQYTQPTGTTTTTPGTSQGGTNSGTTNTNSGGGAACSGTVTVSASRVNVNANSNFEAQISGVSGCTSAVFNLQGGTSASCTFSGNSCSTFMRAPSSQGTYLLQGLAYKNGQLYGSGYFNLSVVPDESIAQTQPNGGYIFPSPTPITTTGGTGTGTGTGTTPGGGNTVTPGGGTTGGGNTPPVSNCTGTPVLSMARVSNLSPDSAIDVNASGLSGCGAGNTITFSISEGGTWSPKGTCNLANGTSCSAVIRTPGAAGSYFVIAALGQSGSGSDARGTWSNYVGIEVGGNSAGAGAQTGSGTTNTTTNTTTGGGTGASSVCTGTPQLSLSQTANLTPGTILDATASGLSGCSSSDVITFSIRLNNSWNAHGTCTLSNGTNCRGAVRVPSAAALGGSRQTFVIAGLNQQGTGDGAPGVYSNYVGIEIAQDTGAGGPPTGGGTTTPPGGGSTPAVSVCTGTPSLAVSQSANLTPGTIIDATVSGLSGCSSRDVVTFSVFLNGTWNAQGTCTLDNGTTCRGAIRVPSAAALPNGSRQTFVIAGLNQVGTGLGAAGIYSNYVGIEIGQDTGAGGPGGTNNTTITTNTSTNTTTGGSPSCTATSVNLSLSTGSSAVEPGATIGLDASVAGSGCSAANIITFSVNENGAWARKASCALTNGQSCSANMTAPQGSGSYYALAGLGQSGEGVNLTGAKAWSDPVRFEVKEGGSGGTGDGSKPENLTIIGSATCQDGNPVATVGWTGSGTGWVLDVSSDSGFGSYSNKSVSGVSSTTIPAGLSPEVRLGSGKQYFFRIWTGTEHSSSGNFLAQSCEGQGGGDGDQIRLRLTETGGVLGVKTSGFVATSSSKPAVLQAATGPVGLQIDSPPEGEVGKAYMGDKALGVQVALLNEQGGVIRYLLADEYEISQAGQTPPGLTFNVNNCQCIDGTPTDTGSTQTKAYSFSITARTTAKFNAAKALNDTKNVTINVKPVSVAKPDVKVVLPGKACGETSSFTTGSSVHLAACGGEGYTVDLSVDNVGYGRATSRNSLGLYDASTAWVATEGSHTIKAVATNAGGTGEHSLIVEVTRPTTVLRDGSQDSFKQYTHLSQFGATISVRNYGQVTLGKFLYGLAGCESTYNQNSSGTELYQGRTLYYGGLHQYQAATWESSNRARLGANAQIPVITNGYAQIDNTAWIIQSNWASIGTQWPGCTNGISQPGDWEWTDYVAGW